jgi:hypothetical protein
MAGEEVQVLEQGMFAPYAEQLRGLSQEKATVDAALAEAEQRKRQAEQDVIAANQAKMDVYGRIMKAASDAQERLWSLPAGSISPTEFAMAAAFLEPSADPLDFEVARVRSNRMAELLGAMQKDAPVIVQYGTAWVGGTFMEGPIRTAKYELGFSFLPALAAAKKVQEDLELDSGAIARPIPLASLAYRESADTTGQKADTRAIVAPDLTFGIGRDAIATLIRKAFSKRDYSDGIDSLHGYQLNDDASLLAALGEAGMNLLDCGLAQPQIDAISGVMFDYVKFFYRFNQPHSFEAVAALRGIGGDASQRLVAHAEDQLSYAVAEMQQYPETEAFARRLASNVAVARTGYRIDGHALNAKAAEILQEFIDRAKAQA